MFPIRPLALAMGPASAGDLVEAVLEAETVDGVPLVGSDTLRVWVPGP